MARRAILDAKLTEGWYRDAPVSETTIETSEEHSLAGWWLHALGLGLTIAALAAGYLLIDRLPDPYPTHWDASGRVDATTTRTPLAVATMPLIILASQGVITALAIALTRQSLRLRADDPSSTRSHRDRTLEVLGGASLVSGLVVWVIQGAAWGWWSGRALPWVVAAILAVALLACFLIVLSERHRRPSGPVGVDGPDDDHLYRWGIFYVNPDDPALMVEKRFGYGADLNYGHPAGRIIGAILALLIVGTIAVLIWGVIALG